MHITQGQFSFLPPLNDEEIRAQVDYAISKGWAVSVEWTDDPHPRNVYWNMWGHPMFEIKDGAAVTFELSACRKANPNSYIKVNAFDNTRGVESMVMSFIVNRPASEPGFALERQEAQGRVVRYTTRSYSMDKPVTR
jgi:ribulose-bisphosphate carboxylase small chain